METFTPVSAPFWRQRRWLLPAALAGSLLLALILGAGLACSRRSSGKVVVADSTPADSSPGGVRQVEAITSRHKGQAERERILLDAAEPYLSPAEGYQPEKVRIGFDLCLELAVLYLDAHRLDDAKQFFARLEAITRVRAYNQLGKLGRAVVLALQSKARESNALFRDFAEVAPFRDGAGKKPDKGAGKKIFEPEPLAWATPRFRFWVAEALHYNQRNGIRDAEVPPTLLRVRLRAERFERKEK